jgi:hypothetical protein
MATERASQHHMPRGERPSDRIVPVPQPGTDDAALLANLNEVYGESDPDEERVLAGIRQSMRDALEREP